MKKAVAILVCIMMLMSVSLQVFAVKAVPVTGISLDKTQITLVHDQIYDLKVTLTPANTTQKFLTFTTSNKNVASIDVHGRILGINNGTTEITVTTSNKQISAKCTVTVVKAASKPVKLSIIDVAGNLQMTQGAIDDFKAANRPLVASVEYVKLTAPELTAKIQAQQAANNIENAMVLTGFDGLASGMEAGIWEQLWPAFKDRMPDLESKYLPGALKAFEIGKGNGIVVTFCPGGPMFTYNPDKVKSVPKTPAELLAWAKQNPNKFLYARPANSGPGRSFLQGLPYILGDKDPKDPKTWTKTWAYLKELDKYIEYYPTGTGVTFTELGQETRWIIASHVGWDMNQRILQTNIPATYQGFFFDNTTWINDAHFVCVPKGLDQDRKNVVFALITYMMKPKPQAVTYDNGYFYPGPAIKNVPLTLAPADTQKKITAAMRPEYDKAIADFPNETSLDPAAMVLAFDMWDKLVGAKIKK
jgi:putative spermidine/putrescine transport system substrate-binding protein